jgi:bloom syndrome protein
LKTGNANALESIANLIQTKYPDQCGIVYTISRKNAEDVAQKLCGFGIKAAHYHASVPPEEKVATQREWQKDRIRVVVATIAFGMGIDKPDVRFVIHHGLPKSLEGYYQETGRAGRDGNPSDCYLYFSHSDARVLRKLISDGEGGWEQKERQKGMLNRMVAFCDNPSDCRRVEVLRYFGEAFDRADCNKGCDNCRTGAVSEQQDFTAIAQAAIEAVAQESRLTSNQCADLLMGKGKANRDENETDNPNGGDGRFRAPAAQAAPQYRGIAKHMKKYEVERIIDRLTVEGALGEDNVMNRRAGFAVQYLKVSLSVPCY